jgi:hypothetical protein
VRRDRRRAASEQAALHLPRDADLSHASCSDSSYLPRVIGIFLAVLDPSQSGGSKVLCEWSALAVLLSNLSRQLSRPSRPGADQVPSNLITTSASSASAAPSGSHPLSQSLASLSVNGGGGAGDELQQPSSGTSSASRTRSPHEPRSRSPLREPLRSPSNGQPPQSLPSASGPYGVVDPPTPLTPETPSPPKQPLLSFEQIASFCVPQTPLCNRLCTITSGAYKIQGYPMLHEDKDARKGYERHEFRWNICWVFDRWKYQGQEYNQVVRKVARVLASCEVRRAEGTRVSVAAHD